MRFLWHPLSDVFLVDPPVGATHAALRFVLGRAESEALRYVGDRMWPAIRHHQPLTVTRVRRELLRRGAVVAASCDGRLDILRIASVSDGELILTADADPGFSIRVPLDEVIAIVQARDAVVPGWRQSLNRLRLELEEALAHGPDAGADRDAAETVREKYDAQATGYRDTRGDDLEPALLERIRARLPRGRSILVVGSGTGRESFALAQEGWNVVGVDFAPRMVEIARERAEKRGLPASFLLGDIRSLEWSGPPFAAAVFTYDVYSFIPGTANRVAVLGNIARCLEADGAVYLSARRVRTAWTWLMLGAGRMARPLSAWGDSHTRWLSTDGEVRRSFVHLFTLRSLRTEAKAAGFLLQSWSGGHGLLTRTGNPTTATARSPAP